MLELDHELIKTIANEIVNQAILSNYRTYLLITAISLITGSLTAFLYSYFKKRGENFATKTDFNEILSQLRETTKSTEEIKSKINAKFLDEHKLKILVREKLEQIISETFELELWLERARSQALHCELPDTNASPISKIEMYQSIYFKDVEKELTALCNSYYPMVNFILEVAEKAIKGKLPNLDDYKNNFTELQSPLLNNLNGFRKSLIEKYAPKFGL